MKQMMFLSIALLLPVVLASQSQRWVYRYNGAASSADEAYAVVYGADGNVYAAGYTSETGNSDFTVIGLDNQGNERWKYQYNGTGYGNDAALSLACGSDGNLYAAGYTVDASFGEQITLVSLTTAGAERWVRFYNGSSSSPNDDRAQATVYGTDGNVYCAGYTANTGTSYDFTIVSYDAAGNFRWAYIYTAASLADRAYDLVYGPDNNIYAAGYRSTGTNGDEYTVISVTNGGTYRWRYSFGTSGSTDYARAIAYDSANNRVWSTGACGSSPYTDFNVQCMSSAGAYVWGYSHSSGVGNCMGNDIIIGTDGDTYAAGFIDMPMGAVEDFDIKNFPGPSMGWDYYYNRGSVDKANTLVYGPGNIIYGAGLSTGTGTGYDFCIVSITNAGTYRWAYNYNGPGSGADESRSLVFGPDTNIYAAGYSTGSGTAADFTVISVAAPLISVAETDVAHLNRFVVAPTVFTQRLELYFSVDLKPPLHIRVYNSLGACVFEKSWIAVNKQLILDDANIGKLDAGVYFLSLKTGNENLGKVKLIKR